MPLGYRPGAGSWSGVVSIRAVVVINSGSVPGKSN
jgi:hypothetical protein